MPEWETGLYMVCIPEATDLGAWRCPGRLAGAQHCAVEEVFALGELAAFNKWMDR